MSCPAWRRCCRTRDDVEPRDARYPDVETIPFTPETINPITISGGVGLLVLVIAALVRGNVVPGSRYTADLAAKDKLAKEQDERHAVQVAEKNEHIDELEAEVAAMQKAIEAMRDDRDQWRIEHTALEAKMGIKPKDDAGNATQAAAPARKDRRRS